MKKTDKLKLLTLFAIVLLTSACSKKCNTETGETVSGSWPNQSCAISDLDVASLPEAPIIGTATPGDTSVSLTFTAPASTGGAEISSYTATSIPGGLTGTGTGSPIAITGLTNGTSYTFTVTATNSAGIGAASAASNSVTPGCVTCRIFLTNSQYLGGTGILGFDNMCNSDFNNPGDGSSYKALVGAVTRQPPSTDWPLKALTNYFQIDGTTLVATTNASGVFTFPMTNPMALPFQNVWTGLSSAMTVSANNCLNWTSSSISDLGIYGVSSLASSPAISQSTQTCDQF